ncbi:MAG: helix-turn-helix transcriptional regulator [Thermoleophilia bacterium]
MALTQTERRVARLVGTGLGNAEIAEEMVVSTKTVEYHLTNIYRKLQVGRIELIRMMRSGGDADPGTPT